MHSACRRGVGGLEWRGGGSEGGGGGYNLDVCLCCFISLYSELSGDAALQHVTILCWTFFFLVCEGGETRPQ